MKLFLRILFTSFFILNYDQGLSQELDFHSPIDAPFDLSGTFGEYRSRFHTGIDFKSRGVQGQNIFSIEEGYISRIEVNNYGYGKVVYIDHPNGYTSVYAHLKDFSSELDKFVRGEQYRLRKSTIKKFPKKGELKVEKGQLIGYSGNTGGSFGPHLHFEIRDTDTQDALNPLMFNYKYLDKERPIIRGLYLIDEDNTLVTSLPLRKEIKKLNDSTYTTNDVEFSKKTGLGIDIYDIQYKNLFNQNGVYKVDVLLNEYLYKGIMNIGYKPTVSEGTKQSLEVHIFDFNDDIYDADLTVHFKQFIRDEIKFSSIDELIQQISKDIEDINKN